MRAFFAKLTFERSVALGAATISGTSALIGGASAYFSFRSSQAAAESAGISAAQSDRSVSPVLVLDCGARVDLKDTDNQEQATAIHADAVYEVNKTGLGRDLLGVSQHFKGTYGVCTVGDYGQSPALSVHVPLLFCPSPSAKTADEANKNGLACGSSFAQFDQSKCQGPQGSPELYFPVVSPQAPKTILFYRRDVPPTVVLSSMLCARYSTITLPMGPKPLLPSTERVELSF